MDFEPEHSHHLHPILQDNRGAGRLNTTFINDKRGLPGGRPCSDRTCMSSSCPN